MTYRGVVLGLYAADPDFDYRLSLDEIGHSGANTVLLLVTVDQQSISSPRVEPLTAHTLRTLRRVLREARSRDLEVGIIPILALREIAKGKWRGTLAPADWSAWFESYRKELLTLGRIAEAHQASLFSVGSELCSSEEQTDEWSTTIEQVRQIFSGHVTYSSNWDHLPRQPFVRDLDYLGLNAYYELVCDGQLTSLPVLVESWQRVQNAEILPWQRQFDKPLLFLEVGYPSSAGADRYPWDYTAAGRIDESIQETLYLAFIQAWDPIPSLEGVFFYVWWEGPDRDARGYTPRAKPAGELLRTWYRTLGPFPELD